MPNFIALVFRITNVRLKKRFFKFCSNFEKSKIKMTRTYDFD